MDTKKKIIVICLIAIMAIGIVFMFVKGKDLFTQTIKITYPDGCIEVYKGDNMTTPICTEGRLLKEMADEQQVQNSWKNNLINPNVK